MALLKNSGCYIPTNSCRIKFNTYQLWTFVYLLLRVGSVLGEDKSNLGRFVGYSSLGSSSLDLIDLSTYARKAPAQDRSDEPSTEKEPQTTTKNTTSSTVVEENIEYVPFPYKELPVLVYEKKGQDNLDSQLRFQLTDPTTISLGHHIYQLKDNDPNSDHHVFELKEPVADQKEPEKEEFASSETSESAMSLPLVHNDTSVNDTEDSVSEFDETTVEDDKKVNDTEEATESKETDNSDIIQPGSLVSLSPGADDQMVLSAVGNQEFNFGSSSEEQPSYYNSNLGAIYGKAVDFDHASTTVSPVGNKATVVPDGYQLSQSQGQQQVSYQHIPGQATYQTQLAYQPLDGQIAYQDANGQIYQGQVVYQNAQGQAGQGHGDKFQNPQAQGIEYQTPQGQTLEYQQPQDQAVSYQTSQGQIIQYQQLPRQSLHYQPSQGQQVAYQLPQVYQGEAYQNSQPQLQYSQTPLQYQNLQGQIRYPNSEAQIHYRNTHGQLQFQVGQQDPYQGSQRPTPYQDAQGAAQYQDAQGAAQYQDAQGAAQYQDAQGAAQYQDAQGSAHYQDAQAAAHYQDAQAAAHYQDAQAAAHYQDAQAAAQYQDAQSAVQYQDAQSSQEAVQYPNGQVGQLGYSDSQESIAYQPTDIGSQLTTQTPSQESGKPSKNQVVYHDAHGDVVYQDENGQLTYEPPGKNKAKTASALLEGSQTDLQTDQSEIASQPTAFDVSGSSQVFVNDSPNHSSRQDQQQFGVDNVPGMQLYYSQESQGFDQQPFKTFGYELNNNNYGSTDETSRDSADTEETTEEPELVEIGRRYSEAPSSSTENPDTEASDEAPTEEPSTNSPKISSKTDLNIEPFLRNQMGPQSSELHQTYANPPTVMLGGGTGFGNVESPFGSNGFQGHFGFGGNFGQESAPRPFGVNSGQGGIFGNQRPSFTSMLENLAAQASTMNIRGGVFGGGHRGESHQGMNINPFQTGTSDSFSFGSQLEPSSNQFGLGMGSFSGGRFTGFQGYNEDSLALGSNLGGGGSHGGPGESGFGRLQESSGFGSGFPGVQRDRYRHGIRHAHFDVNEQLATESQQRPSILGWKPDQKPLIWNPNQNPPEWKPDQKLLQWNYNQKPLDLKPDQKPLEWKPDQKPLQWNGDQKPLQWNGDQKPLQWNGDQKPLQWNGDQTPLQWNGDQTPLQWNGDQKPLQWNGDQKPLQWNGDQKPLQWNGDQKPLQWNGDQKPLQWNGDQKPLQWNGDQKPLQWNGDQKPLQWNDDQKPLQWNGDQKPLQLNAEQKPLESNVDHKPLQLNAEQKPLEWNVDHKPLQWNADQKPLHWNPDQKPIEWKPDQKPMESKPDQKPIEWQPDQKPIEWKPEQKPTEWQPDQKPIEWKPDQWNQNQKPLQWNPDQKPLQWNPDQKPLQWNPDQKPLVWKPDQKPIEWKPDQWNPDNKPEQKPFGLVGYGNQAVSQAFTTNHRARPFKEIEDAIAFLKQVPPENIISPHRGQFLLRPEEPHFPKEIRDPILEFVDKQIMEQFKKKPEEKPVTSTTQKPPSPPSPIPPPKSMPPPTTPKPQTYHIVHNIMHSVIHKQQMAAQKQQQQQYQQQQQHQQQKQQQQQQSQHQQTSPVVQNGHVYRSKPRPAAYGDRIQLGQQASNVAISHKGAPIIIYQGIPPSIHTSATNTKPLSSQTIRKVPQALREQKGPALRATVGKVGSFDTGRSIPYYHRPVYPDGHKPLKQNAVDSYITRIPSRPLSRPSLRPPTRRPTIKQSSNLTTQKSTSYSTIFRYAGYEFPEYKFDLNSTKPKSPQYSPPFKTPEISGKKTASGSTPLDTWTAGLYSHKSEYNQVSTPKTETASIGIRRSSSVTEGFGGAGTWIPVAKPEESKYVKAIPAVTGDKILYTPRNF